MAPPNEPPTHITLRIKVAPGHIEGGADEYTLPDPIAVTSRIGELREQIKTYLPSNPATERQRILYSGRALVDNEQTVADALNIRREPTQSEYVVHLLVRGGNPAAGPSRTAASTGQHGLAAQQPQIVNPDQSGVPLPSAMFPGHIEHHQHHHGPDNAAFPNQQGLDIHERLRQMNEHNQRMMQAQQAAIAQGQRDMHERMRQTNEQRARAGSPQQGQTNATSQQAQPNTPSQQAQPNVPPQTGAGQGHPQVQGFFMQGVGPNGERIAMHQQRINVNFQHPGPHTHHLPPGAHGLPPGVFGMQPLGMQNQPNNSGSPAPSGSPALERAREQMAEMLRLIEEVRAENPPDQATPEQLARLARMDEQARNINSYIDPFNLGNGNRDAVVNDAATPSAARQPPHVNPANLFNARRHLDPNNNGNNTPAPTRTWTLPPERAFNARRHLNNGNIPAVQFQTPRATRVPPPTNSEDTTCYLLSDPTGLPQALLMTPQHGTFTGTLANNSHIPAAPRTTAAQRALPHLEQARALVEEARAAMPPPAPANGGDRAAVNPNPMNFLLAHFWLLLRIMIFSYFLLGSNLGWRRPLALGAIGLGFWLVRAGMLGDGAVFRGWWEGIVREGAAAVEPPAAARNANAGEMPTPEEVARRLLEERRRGEGEWARWGRERLRAVVLMIASLWPGVGEAFVRAREAEDRRLAEEEVAAARRREEERAANEQAAQGGEDDEVQGQGEVKDSAAAATGDAATTDTQVTSTAEQTAAVSEKSDEKSSEAASSSA